MGLAIQQTNPWSRVGSTCFVSCSTYCLPHEGRLLMIEGFLMGFSSCLGFGFKGLVLRRFCARGEIRGATKHQITLLRVIPTVLKFSELVAKVADNTICWRQVCYRDRNLKNFCPLHWQNAWCSARSTWQRFWHALGHFRWRTCSITLEMFLTIRQLWLSCHRWCVSLHSFRCRI